VAHHPSTDAIAWVDDEVAARRKAEYDSEQEAFAHVAMRVLLDLDDDEAYEACEVGREIDGGPDAFWLDGGGSPGIASVVAYAPAGKAVGDPSLLARLSVALERLSLPRGKDKKAKALAALPRRLALLHEREAGVPLEAWIVCFGKLDEGVRKEFKKLCKSEESEELRFRLIERDEFRARAVEVLSRDLPAMRDPVTLKLHDHFEYKAEPPAIVANINALELAELEQKYGFRIFQSNVRYLLKGRQGINDGIANTVNDAGERNNFWYYNNGIAVMCDSFEPPVKKDGEYHLTIHNFQIVNGCQTTATLARTIDSLQEADPPVQILARIVASEDSELRDSIPLYNNRQNAVIPRDLQSNDRVQTRLQGEFERFDPPWFYIRKRGEWEARGENQRLKKIFADRRVENDLSAHAYYAFFRDAAAARARKRYLFTSTKENGFYEEIFNTETKPEPLLLAYRAAKYVKREVNAYRREIRGVKRGVGSAVEQKKLDKEWLKFGEQYVLGVIGWHVLRHVPMHSPTVKKLATAKFEEFIDVAYRIAIGDLTLYFRRVAREQPTDSDGNRERIDYANFVKGNWDDVLQTLEVEWTEIREGESDPLGDFFP
jgi:hypothetical protein